jgi:hypothetical protein
MLRIIDLVLQDRKFANLGYNIVWLAATEGILIISTVLSRYTMILRI